MSWLLRATPPDDAVPMPAQVPGAGAQFAAAARRQYIEDDSWSRGLSFQRELRDEIVEQLGPQAPNYSLVLAERRAGTFEDPDQRYIERVLQSALAQAEADPGPWAGVPLTREDFDAEVLRRRRREWEEANETLRRGQSALAQVGGSMAAAMTDEVSVATLPLGGPFARGGLAAFRFVAGEATLGAASEAAILPRASRTADELGLPAPNPVQRLAFGALGAGGLASGMVAGARALAYLRGARVAERETLPPGADALQARSATSAAEIDLRTGQPSVEALATQRQALPMDAPTLLATTGSDGALRAMIRLPDGTRLTGLDVGATLPDGAHIAAIEPGRIRLQRGGETISAEVGQALSAPTPREPAASPQIDERPDSPAARFVFAPGGNADPAVNPVGYAAGWLIERGYQPHIAFGLVGNLMQESSPSLNTRLVGDGGLSYGMGQWHRDRRAALFTFAEREGRDVNDIETQLMFLHHELQGPENAALRAILQAPDAETAARIASEQFWRPGVPRIENRMGYAAALQRQFDEGGVPTGGRPDRVAPQAPTSGAWADAVPNSGTRETTAWNEVSSPTGTRTGVRWEVVELDSLRAATGDLQPRDRSRAASDEQISQIAANLDPARLLPSPEADRGAPIVGPDDIVESGNGRIGALARAADMHPDQYGAYVQTLRDRGFDVPQTMRRPVLVGRRTSDMTPEQRIAWVRENNTSAIARMGGAEQARMDARYLSQPVMDALRPAADLAAPENGVFLRRLFEGMPLAERTALVDAAGRVTMDGIRRVRSALFARAWGDDALIRLVTEKPSAELRALVAMMEDLAPHWAHFRAMVDAGFIRPEFDVTPAITDMVRLIGELRGSDRDGQSVVAALRDYLATPDLLAPRDPALSDALLSVFYPGARARRPVEAGEILQRFVAEAATVGRADIDDLLSAPPAPAEVLTRAIAAQQSGDAMPAPPVPPARVAPDPVSIDADATLPAAETGAASPDLIALDAAAEAEMRQALDPNRPEYLNTRGQGVRYHGARGPIERLTPYLVGSEGNYYGPGFYTSDAVAVTAGYAKRGGVIYRIDETGAIRALDMEAPIPDWFARSVQDDLGVAALAEEPKNLREFYDQVRALSPDFNLPKWEVQDLFYGYADTIRAQGFNALDHRGGLKTKTADHAVRIYLDPGATIRITEVQPPRPDAPPAAAAAQEPAPAAMAADQADAAATDLAAAPGLDAAPSPLPTAARDAVAVDAADYLALRDLTFRVDENGPELTLRAILDDLDADAELEDVLAICTRRGQ